MLELQVEIHSAFAFLGLTGIMLVKSLEQSGLSLTEVDVTSVLLSDQTAMRPSLPPPSPIMEINPSQNSSHAWVAGLVIGLVAVTVVCAGIFFLFRRR
jgi:hypothetical protein